jgi:hypothetical protein
LGGAPAPPSNRAVIPALVAGIQLSANARASRALDPGHKARDDSTMPEDD